MSLCAMGAKDVLALGGCSYVVGASLPTTAQVGKCEYSWWWYEARTG